MAVSKSAMNELGPFSAAGFIYFFSGIINFLIIWAVSGGKMLFEHLKDLPLKYYTRTGIFIVFNNVFFYLALGLAKTNEELILVALINYLWPVLIAVFRIPIYKVKVKPWLFYPGILAALAGIIIALLQGYDAKELLRIAAALDDNFLAFIFALIGAVSWAVYSNLIGKSAHKDDKVALPVIFVLSGLVFFILQFFSKDAQNLSLYPLISNPSLIYTIIGPTSLGYLFWFFAMKNGNSNLVTSLSYLIPLGSVFILSIIHSIPVKTMFWVSAILIVSGAILGMQAVKSKNY